MTARSLPDLWVDAELNRSIVPLGFGHDANQDGRVVVIYRQWPSGYFRACDVADYPPGPGIDSLLPNEEDLSLRLGVYRHYKQHPYLTLGLGLDLAEPGRVVAVYIGLELDEAHVGPRLAIRSLNDFKAWVNPDTGVAFDHRSDTPPGLVLRFDYIGPSWEGHL